MQEEEQKGAKQHRVLLPKQYVPSMLYPPCSYRRWKRLCPLYMFMNSMCDMLLFFFSLFSSWSYYKIHPASHAGTYCMLTLPSCATSPTPPLYCAVPSMRLGIAPANMAAACSRYCWRLGHGWRHNRGTLLGEKKCSLSSLFHLCKTADCNPPTPTKGGGGGLLGKRRMRMQPRSAVSARYREHHLVLC